MPKIEKSQVVDRRKESIKSVLKTYRSGDIVTKRQTVALLYRDYNDGALTESGLRLAMKDLYPEAKRKTHKFGFSTIKYGRFNCKGCGRLSRKVWVESLSYKKKLCAPCLDAKGLGMYGNKGKK